MNLRSRYSRKTENRFPPKITAVLHYRRKNTAIFRFTASAKGVTAEKLKTAYRQKITTVLHYRRKHTAIFWFYRFRQSRYRQKRENGQPPKNYCRMAIPPRLCPPKKPLPTTTLKKMYNLFFLSRCHIISTTSFLPVGNTPYRKPQNTRTICTTPLQSILEAGLRSWQSFLVRLTSQFDAFFIQKNASETKATTNK